MQMRCQPRSSSSKNSAFSKDALSVDRRFVWRKEIFLWNEKLWREILRIVAVRKRCSATS